MSGGRTTGRRRLLGLIGAALLMAAPAGVGAQAPDDLGSAVEGYDEAVAQEAAVLEAYDASVLRVEQLNAEVAALEERLGAVEAELAAAETAVRAAQDRLGAARAELTAVRAELAFQQDRLRSQAVDSYVGAGRAEGASLSMMAASTANDAGKTQVYAGVVVEEQRRTVERVKGLTEEAGRLEAEASSAEVAAAEARDRVVARRDELAATRAERIDAQAAASAEASRQQGLLAEIQARRNDYLQRIAELTTASDGIGQILAARQAGQQLPASTSRIFGHPVTPMRVGSPFGPRMHPVYRVMRLHRGADLSARQGQPIIASADGVVAIAEVRGGYGNCVVIDHGNGLATLYAHQSAMAVRAGDVVARGDVIGSVGSTGVSTAPHLHFEVRVYGDAVDPVPFLEAF